MFGKPLRSTREIDPSQKSPRYESMGQRRAAKHRLRTRSKIHAPAISTNRPTVWTSRRNNLRSLPGLRRRETHHRDLDPSSPRSREPDRQNRHPRFKQACARRAQPRKNLSHCLTRLGRCPQTRKRFAAAPCALQGEEGIAPTIRPAESRPDLELIRSHHPRPQ